MKKDYTYDHGWAEERMRLAGLETALDPGTRSHLARLGVRPGTRCLEIGAGGGSVAFWLSEQVAPSGTVVATDLETDFLESEASGRPCLEVLRHDIMADALPTGFDLLRDLIVVGLLNVEAEGRCPIVRGGHPLAAHFLRLTLEKLREPLLSAGHVTKAAFEEAVAALEDPAVTVVAPMTVAAWGWRA
jgi:hypothetical protein